MNRTNNRIVSIKLGDVFAIPLAEQLFGVGIVLHISTYFTGSMLIGVFDKCFSSLEAILVTDLTGDFAFVPNYTGKQLLMKGEWPIIGNRLDLVDKSIIPELVIVTDVFYKDELVTRLPSLEEARKYEPVRGQGKGFIENKLRRYFSTRKCR